MEVDVLERFYAVTNEALEEAKNEVRFRLPRGMHPVKGRTVDHDNM